MGADIGRAKVMGDAVADAARALADQKRAADGEQLALMPLPTRFTGARAEHLQRASAERRGVGRPAGAENKNTAQLRAFLLSRGRHPLQLLIEWSQHTPTTLAAELGCTRLEAFDRLRALWADAAPYFAAKLAPTDDAGNIVPALLLQIGGQAVGSGGRKPWEYDGGPSLDHQQNQALSLPIDAVSHATVSHEVDK